MNTILVKTATARLRELERERKTLNLARIQNGAHPDYKTTKKKTVLSPEAMNRDMEARRKA